MTAVEPFATPTTCLIHFEANGIPERKRALGALRRLPRPWDPFTCADPDLRLELWVWLDDVVTCINHEYVWDTAAYIPKLLARTPHLVHDIAILADQRRRAGRATASDALDDWHRYGLPAFLGRMSCRSRPTARTATRPPHPPVGTLDTPATRTAGDAPASSTPTPPSCARRSWRPGAAQR